MLLVGAYERRHKQGWPERLNLCCQEAHRDVSTTDDGVRPLPPHRESRGDVDGGGRAGGGAEGNRTPDLCSAIAALSHLSYSPAPFPDVAGAVPLAARKSGCNGSCTFPDQKRPAAIGRCDEPLRRARFRRVGTIGLLGASLAYDMAATMLLRRQQHEPSAGDFHGL